MTNITRCPRCEKDDLYRDYHDHERWIPVHDDNKHFEFLLLESFQAWLSRYTVLKKRENFRVAFDQFDPQKIAMYDEQKVLSLVWDAGIIRHRGKIEAAITNARIFLEIQQEYWSRDRFIRAYTDHKVVDNKVGKMESVPSKTELSDQISKDLKKRWMKFVWSTIVYAHLQATGQVNDHLVDCWKY